MVPCEDARTFQRLIDCVHVSTVPLSLLLQNYTWAATRNRNRISEIINYVERNMIELDELAGEDDMADN